MPMARGRAPVNQGLLTSRVFGGWVEGQRPVQHMTMGHDQAKASHMSGSTSAQEAQVGAYHNSLVPNSPRD